MEVIARKKNGLIVVYFLCTVIGLILTGASICFIFMSINFGGQFKIFDIIMVIFGLIIGIAVLLVSINTIIAVKKTPQIILTYENGKLKFFNNEFLPSQLVNVEYRRAHARGISYRWGMLKIILENQTFKCEYVAEVEQAHNRLIQLMMESRENKGI